jgi:hypothetical protein
MSTYRIHRLKEHLRQQFRYAPHVSGEAAIKPRDYEPEQTPGDTVEADSPYAVFFALRDTHRPLEVGDVLELDGALQIFKFVGFEAARWVVPETKPEAGPESGAPGAPSTPVTSALQ